MKSKISLRDSATTGLWRRMKIICRIWRTRLWENQTFKSVSKFKICKTRFSQNPFKPLKSAARQADYYSIPNPQKVSKYHPWWLRYSRETGKAELQPSFQLRTA